MTVQVLLEKLDQIIHLHRRNDDMWVDFFETARDKIIKDAAFGCEYLMMAWHGIGGYDDERIFTDDADERKRKELHPHIYKLAQDIKHAQH